MGDHSKSPYAGKAMILQVIMAFRMVFDALPRVVRPACATACFVRASRPSVEGAGKTVLRHSRTSIHFHER
jgi:hypothetical protein